MITTMSFPIPTALFLLLSLQQHNVVVVHAIPTIFYGPPGATIKLDCPVDTVCLRPKEGAAIEATTSDLTDLQEAFAKTLDYEFVTDGANFEFTCEDEKCDIVCSTERCKCDLMGEGGVKTGACSSASPTQGSVWTEFWPIFISSGPTAISLQCPKDDGAQSCVIGSSTNSSEVDNFYDVNSAMQTQKFNCTSDHTCSAVCPTSRCRCWQAPIGSDNENATETLCPVVLVDDMGRLGNGPDPNPTDGSQSSAEQSALTAYVTSTQVAKAVLLAAVAMALS